MTLRIRPNKETRSLIPRRRAISLRFKCNSHAKREFVICQGPLREFLGSKAAARVLSLSLQKGYVPRSFFIFLLEVTILLLRALVLRPSRPKANQMPNRILCP